MFVAAVFASHWHKGVWGEREREGEGGGGGALERTKVVSCSLSVLIHSSVIGVHHMMVSLYTPKIPCTLYILCVYVYEGERERGRERERETERDRMFAYSE